MMKAIFGLMAMVFRTPGVSEDPGISGKSDEELVPRVQRGEPDIFGLLVDRHSSRVYGFLLRMVGQPPQAEELTRDSFNHALEELPAFRPHRGFAGWLMGIARNLCLDWMKRNQEAGDGRQEAGGKSRESAGMGHEKEVIGKAPSQPEDVGIWFAAIPLNLRSVLALRYAGKLEIGEIAALEGISPGAVKDRLHAGRELLRSRLPDGELPRGLA